MKISSWNIRGLNDPIKQHEVRQFLMQNHIDIITIVEVKVRLNKVEKVAKNTFPRWKVVHNTGIEVIPRKWCRWNAEKFKGTVVADDRHCLILEMTIKNTQQQFVLSVV